VVLRNWSGTFPSTRGVVCKQSETRRAQSRPCATPKLAGEEFVNNAKRGGPKVDPCATPNDSNEPRSLGNSLFLFSPATADSLPVRLSGSVIKPRLPDCTRKSFTSPGIPFWLLLSSAVLRLCILLSLLLHHTVPCCRGGFLKNSLGCHSKITLNEQLERGHFHGKFLSKIKSQTVNNEIAKNICYRSFYNFAMST
jgi:hypothetical protein